MSSLIGNSLMPRMAAVGRFDPHIVACDNQVIQECKIDDSIRQCRTFGVIGKWPGQFARFLMIVIIRYPFRPSFIVGVL